MPDHPLLAEIAEIDRALLRPVTTRPPDALRPDERVQTRAYLLMAHAVLEERIEGIFLEHFLAAREIVATGAAVPSGLLGFYASALEWGTKFIPQYADRQWLKVMSSAAALKHVTSQVDRNHGLKDANVERLAKLVGIEWTVLDDDAGIELAALETLGAKRGAAGHRSPFGENNSALDGQDYPQNVREWVNQAARSVIRIEEVVRQLSAPVAPAESLV